jgi:hypothetical protein
MSFEQMSSFAQAVLILSFSRAWGGGGRLTRCRSKSTGNAKTCFICHGAFANFFAAATSSFATIMFCVSLQRTFISSQAVDIPASHNGSFCESPRDKFWLMFAINPRRQIN